MVAQAAHHSRYFRQVAIYDANGQALRHASAILTNHRGAWHGVVTACLVRYADEELVLRTPEGGVSHFTVEAVDHSCEIGTLITGTEPPPF
jgi:hypothetical protein